ncbi:hypothetical protein EON66_06195 [archaeon]|nr:MAG: hypothetical protein EON66_06195 [archaeon]
MRLCHRYRCAAVAEEYWTERSWTTMTLDNALRQPSRGDVRVRVTTLRLNASDESACFLIPLSSTSVYERATLQLARSENGPLCQFTVTLPRFLSLQQQYAAAGTVPMLPATLTLESQASASGTQIVDFEIQVDDAKESAYSRGYLSRSIPTNSSGGRMVAASVSLMPSIFDDRSYFTRAQGGSVSTGYRAAFPLLNVTLADVGRDDKLVITFNPVAMTLYTERWPRLGILQVLGTLLGLGVGLFLLFKFLHDILDAACGCRSLNRAITCWALRGCKGERPRGWNLARAPRPQLCGSRIRLGMTALHRVRLWVAARPVRVSSVSLHPLEQPHRLLPRCAHSRVSTSAATSWRVMAGRSYAVLPTSMHSLVCASRPHPAAHPSDCGCRFTRTCCCPHFTIISHAPLSLAISSSCFAAPRAAPHHRHGRAAGPPCCISCGPQHIFPSPYESIPVPPPHAHMYHGCASTARAMRAVPHTHPTRPCTVRSLHVLHPDIRFP